MLNTKDLLKLTISIGISLSAGFVGSLFTAPAIPGWYSTLTLPELAPPSWVFAPVWTTLYVLMGVALFLVWRKGLESTVAKFAVAWFVVQLVLNALWSYLFFGLQSPAIAFIDINLLIVSILITIFAFRKVSVLAAWLLVPYLAWVGFATYLNLMIWVINM